MDLTTRFHESQLTSVPKTKNARNLPTFTPFLGGGVVTSGKSWTRCAEACQARGRATFSHHDERVSRSVFSRPVIHDRPNHRRRRDTVRRNSSLSCVCMEFLQTHATTAVLQSASGPSQPQRPMKCGVRSMCNDNDTLI